MILTLFSNFFRNYYPTISIPQDLKRKIIMQINLIVLLLAFAISQVYGRVYSQITLREKNASLTSVLKQIEKQSGYVFFYNDKDLKDKRITLSLENVSIEKALEESLKHNHLSYKIDQKNVLIRRNQASSRKLHSDKMQFAEQQRATIKGKVINEEGNPLPGVTVMVVDKTTVVTTDENGNYIINFPKQGTVTLVFSIVGYESQEIKVTNQSILDVELKKKVSDIEDVVVVAFGMQKKSTMVGSVSSINPKKLKGPTSNLTNMLAGRIAGVIAYQRSGEPGRDNSDFFIRGVTTFGTGKKDPLILIDGMEVSANDLARIQPDDIAGFSILKDATASSLYGARGANGVVLVSTKSGVEGKTKFNVRFENSLSSNTRNFQLADNLAYMTLANEAFATRDANRDGPYTKDKIEQTSLGANQYLYPNNDWIDLLIKNNTNNQRLNFNLNGGGGKAQYYIAGTVNIDNGVLKTVETNNFNSNVKATNYEIRSNVNVKLTPTTEGIVRTSGRFDSYNGPVGGGGKIFNQVLWSNPVKFPAYFPQEFAPFAKHTLFGNARQDNGGLYVNPFAQAVSGFEQQQNSNVTVQMELKQDFDFFLSGLKARVMAYTRRNSYFDLKRQYSPFYYSATIDVQEGFMGLEMLNEGQGKEYLTYSPGPRLVNTYNYIEFAANYNRIFAEKHDVSGMLIGLASDYLTGNATSLQNSLPRRNQGLSGRFSYTYDSRYLTEFNFGYNGSERFDKKHRYGFFPSIGAAWNIVNETFFEKYKNTITKLKLRGTYGLVGNDQIGDIEDRFFYLSNVNMENYSRAYAFGDNYTESRPGISISRYENRLITWEKAYKTNLGLEVGVNNDLSIEVDVFQEKRKNILMSRAYVPTTMGLNSPIQANVGQAEGKGFEVALDYSKSFYNATWFSFRGNFTYAKSNLLVNEEPNYPESDKLLSKVGHPINQRFGLIAERYFIDEIEVANSPRQNYGKYMAGDIKYRDVNGDGQITNLDLVPIGYPEMPEIIYGFGFSFGYKAFDISAFFQGSARSSFWISPANIAPFVLNGGNQNGLLTHVAESHWSEDNRDLYAFWPRLSDQQVVNNNQVSTWWMRNGAFMRLKNVELGYNVPEKTLTKFGFSNIRFYFTALNLFALSKFKMWDTEMGGNGLGYPVQRVLNLGINVGF